MQAGYCRTSTGIHYAEAKGQFICSDPVQVITILKRLIGSRRETPPSTGLLRLPIAGLSYGWKRHQASIHIAAQVSSACKTSQSSHIAIITPISGI